MRHRRALRKLGRTTAHRMSLLRNLSTSFFQKERIATTLQKAKELRPFAERLITLARRDDLHSRRLVARSIQNPSVLKKLFDTLGPRFAQRNGGYSRILKLGWRQGDGAEMGILELIGSEPTFDKGGKKGKKERKRRGAAPEAATSPAAGEAAEPAERHSRRSEKTEAPEEDGTKARKKGSGSSSSSVARGKKKPKQ